MLGLANGDSDIYFENDGDYRYAIELCRLRGYIAQRFGEDHLHAELLLLNCRNYLSEQQNGKKFGFGHIMIYSTFTKG